MHNFQVNENYKGGNKLSTQHINFKNKKMNEFDILNSKKIFAKYKLKRPISFQNIDGVKERVNEITNYIKILKWKDGRLVTKSTKCTGFVSLIIDLQNFIELFEFLTSRYDSFRYLNTYKLSQDHLEIFFSAMRSRSGKNDNPTAFQFKFAYKRLLIRSKIKGSEHANVINLENIEILACIN